MSRSEHIKIIGKDEAKRNYVVFNKEVWQVQLVYGNLSLVFTTDAFMGFVDSVDYHIQQSHCPQCHNDVFIATPSDGITIRIRSEEVRPFSRLIRDAVLSLQLEIELTNL